MQELIEKIIEKLEDRRKTSERLIMENPQDELDKIQTQAAEDFASAYGEAIEIVKQEAEKHDNGWISCSSGVMPRANGWYLVTNYLGVVQEQRWSANHWEKLRDDAVLAWRELPQPYQPKGE